MLLGRAVSFVILEIRAEIFVKKNLDRVWSGFDQVWVIKINQSEAQNDYSTIQSTSRPKYAILSNRQVQSTTQSRLLD